MEKGKTTPNKSDNATEKKEATPNSKNEANGQSVGTNNAATAQENDTNKATNSNLEEGDASVTEADKTANSEGQNDEKSTKEGETVEEEIDDSEELLPLGDHPYKDLHLSFAPTPEQLAPIKEIVTPKSVEETPLVDVTKREHLEELVEELKKEKEIAVDLQWSDHGYKAVTCLITISSKEKDYIIDAISLKDDLLLLNDIFLDTNIVKIFHAPANDLKWLQQDFDLFVINMFDTQRGMRALGQTKIGLDVALQEYKVEKDLTMARVDFRKRPLPPKYKNFARTAAHFLIHIYERLKNKLIESKLLKKVLSQCNNDCRLVHPKVSDTTYESIRKEIEQMHKRQMQALEKLNEWRHRIAEYIDINIGLVLSKNSMRTLAFELPSDSAYILKVCNKSEYVKEHLKEIVEIMTEAKPQKFPAQSPKPLMKIAVAPVTPKFGAGTGDLSYRRKFNQTDFGRVNSYESPKRPRTFYYEETSRGRGRGRGTGRPTEFYPRSTTYSLNTFPRNNWSNPNLSGRGARW